MILTSKNVNTIFAKCLLSSQEAIDDVSAITVEGIYNLSYCFSKERIQYHINDIASMLHELPSQFRKNISGGESFLNLCNTNGGGQWTDTLTDMEYLMYLGLAARLMKYSFIRSKWANLPSKMPFVHIVQR